MEKKEYKGDEGVNERERKSERRRAAREGKRVKFETNPCPCLCLPALARSSGRPVPVLCFATR